MLFEVAQAAGNHASRTVRKLQLLQAAWHANSPWVLTPLNLSCTSSLSLHVALSNCMVQSPFKSRQQAITLGKPLLTLSDDLQFCLLPYFCVLAATQSLGQGRGCEL
jgi:hypothetical protein